MAHEYETFRDLKLQKLPEPSMKVDKGVVKGVVLI